MGVVVTSVGVLVTSVGVLVTSLGDLVTSVGILVTSVSVLASPDILSLSGITFVPLRTSGGELIQGSGLFVKITKETSISAAGVSSAAPVKHLRSRPRLTYQANVEES